MRHEDEAILSAWAALIASPPRGMPTASELLTIITFAEPPPLNGHSEFVRHSLTLAVYFLQYAPLGEADIEARLRQGVVNFAQASRR